MPSPIGSVVFIHNAIRNDLSGIADDVATAAASGGPTAPAAGRFTGHRHVLRAHELAEEEVIFPAAEAIQAGVTSALVATHDKNRGLQEALEAALAAGDANKAAPIAAELRDSMMAHLDQEEGEFIPFCDANISMEEQGELAGQMAAKIPPEMFPTAVAWIMRNSDFDNRVGVSTMWANEVPPPVFGMIKEAIKNALSESDLSALAAQVPQLND